MRQFSLEEYKKDPSRKVVTRYGSPVKIIYTEAEGNYPIIGLISQEGGERPESFTENGKYINNNGSDSDIFFAPVRREGWVNIYGKNKDYVITGDLVLKTKEEAIKCIGSNDYIATVHIEWEE